ncbi:MAG: hypothetical protein ACK4M9_00905 [Anaerobacillus sp.]|uniref:hypothetical protein n=1 Tax=Anaerobacillus sp. TaxID=1872506 RepID=UPI00391D84E1
MEILLYFSIILIIFYSGFQTYYKSKEKVPIIVFGLLMVCNVTLTILHVLEVSIPSPLEFITFIYKPFSHFLYSLFS